MVMSLIIILSSFKDHLSLSGKCLHLSFSDLNVLFGIRKYFSRPSYRMIHLGNLDFSVPNAINKPLNID